MPHPTQQVSALLSRTLVPAAAAALIAACTASTPESASAPAPEAPAAPAPPSFAPAEGGAPPAAAPAATGETHAVHVETRRNDDGSATLVAVVTPTDGYKLNTDPNFPWRVKVADDAPVAAGTTMGAADAATMEEARAAFEIPVAAPGDAGEVPGEVILGVCDDEGCIRVREEVTWVLAQQ